MDYVDACTRAAEQCAVKSHLKDALRVEVTARREQPRAESEDP
jgi:hypothetical protein